MPRRSYAAAAGSISTARRDVPIRPPGAGEPRRPDREAVFADKPIATDPDVAIERYFARAPHDSHFLASTAISHPLTAGWRCDPPRPEALLAHQAMVDLQVQARCLVQLLTSDNAHRPKATTDPATSANRRRSSL